MRIARARNSPELRATGRLFREYAASLELDLSYQGFEGEVAGLPGKYAPPFGEILLAMDASGEAVGCVALRPLSDGICEMKRLYVAPAGRGQGLGRRLVAAILDEARARGYREMRLDTLVTLETAIGLYREVGFVEIEPYFESSIEGNLFMGLRL